MAKKVPVIILILILLGVGVYYGVKKFEGPTSTLKLSGNVDIRDVDLGFRVFGRLVAVYFDEGDRIAPGDLVAQLDKQPYLDTLANTKAGLLEAEVAFNNAQRTFKRKKELLAKKFISPQEYDDALAQKDEASARVAAANASLLSAQTNLKDTDIFAPSAGVVLTRAREPGSVLTQGETVLTVSLDSPLWVRSYVNGANLDKIFPGMHAQVFSIENPSKVYDAYIGFISPTAEFTPKNVETASQIPDLVYRLRLIVPNPDAYLHQGMPVFATLDLTQKPQNQERGGFTPQTDTSKKSGILAPQRHDKTPPASLQHETGSDPLRKIPPQQTTP